MSDRALWAQAQQDYTQALAIANLAWAARGDATPEAIQAATATILISVQKLRERGGVTPQPAAAAPTSGGKSPQSAAVGLPAIPAACPECGGPLWDNRTNKKNPKAPDWKCKEKSCVDAKGFVTAGWVTKPGGKAVAMATSIRDQVDEGFDKFPKALQGDAAEDDLPF